MDEKTDKEKIQEIEEVYQNFEEKMADLKKEQDMILDEFVADCEKEKIEKLRANFE